MARDSGLAGDRTALAWQRSLLALVAVAALIVREGALAGELALALPLAALPAGAAAVAWLRLPAAERSRRAGFKRGDAGPRIRLIQVVAATTVVAALGSLVLVALR